MIKSIFLTVFLFYGLNIKAQVELKYPDHYKTIEDNDFTIGDTIVADFRFGFPCGEYFMLIDSTYGNKKIIDFLGKNSHFKYDIHVYTDARGSEEANLKLSTKRAIHIKEAVLKFGLDSAQFKNTYGHGESQPIIPEDEIRAMETEGEQEAAHQMNRRTYFVVVELRED